MRIEDLESEVKKLHVENGDVVLVTVPAETTPDEMVGALEQVEEVVKVHHHDVTVLAIHQGIELIHFPADQRKVLAEQLVGPQHRLHHGWYIERDDGEIQEGPFETIHLARTKLHAVYDSPEYRVIWLEPENRFRQPA